MTESITTDIRFSIVPEWVLDAPVSDRAIRVYTILARYADNDTLQAFPSRLLLSERCRCSVKSVDRAVEELMTVGAIDKQRRVKDGHYQSSLYTVKRVAASPVTLGGVTRDTRAASPVTHITRTIELEPHNENDIIQHFNTFWDLFPRKLGKGEAKQAFAKAVNTHGHDVVLDGLRRFVDDPNLPPKQFIPRPATWLNQERWDDEPYPEEAKKPWERLAITPGTRDWVEQMHNIGEHWECRPGEFGH